MEITYDDVQDNVLIIKATGKLTSRTAGEFRQSIGKMVDIRLWNIIVDCSEAEALSIYGLTVIMRLHRQMGEKFGDIKIASARGPIVTCLRTTRLGGMFKLYPDVQAARAAFKKVKKAPIILR